MHRPSKFLLVIGNFSYFFPIWNFNFYCKTMFYLLLSYSIILYYFSTIILLYTFQFYLFTFLQCIIIYFYSLILSFCVDSSLANKIIVYIFELNRIFQKNMIAKRHLLGENFLLPKYKQILRVFVYKPPKKKKQRIF